MAKLVNILVILSVIHCGLGDVNNNKIEDGHLDNNLHSNSGSPDLRMMLSNFISSGAAKQMGQMLLGSEPAGSAIGDILQGIGSMISKNDGSGGGLDLSMITTIFNMMNTNTGSGHNDNDEGGKKHGGFDFRSAISLANSFVKQDDSNDMLSFLPPLLELFAALYGPEAEERAKEHAGHSWLLPPIVERAHVIFDIIMNSKVARNFMKKIGAQKFVLIFSDESGRFNYNKFVQLLDNLEFRAHWIRMFTSKIAQVFANITDPYNQKKYIEIAIFFLNNILQSQGLQEQSIFNLKQPTDSIVGIVKFFTKKYLNMEIDTTFFVRPLVNYVEELLRLVEVKGLLVRGLDSSELTHKLTDTINLEIIEPIARVNRALRFATKQRKCIKYVLCMANSIDPEEKQSLPGLKIMLSQGMTLGACWYLSGHENMNFWSLYEVARNGLNCKNYYLESCHGFHLEESKAREAYVHNEL